MEFAAHMFDREIINRETAEMMQAYANYVAEQQPVSRQTIADAIRKYNKTKPNRIVSVEVDRDFVVYSIDNTPETVTG
jgi:biopolymer transport protein ExbD